MDTDKSDRSNKESSEPLTKKELKELLKKEKKEKKEAANQEKLDAKLKKKQDIENKSLQGLKNKLTENSVTLPAGFNSDADLLRFIRARKGDVDKSYDLLVKCLRWREKEQPQAISEESISRELAAGKSFYLGKDKSGRPTFLVFPGRHEPKAISNEETVRALIYYIEKAIKELDVGGEIDQLSLMVDFEGWGMKNVDHDLDKLLIDTIQNYYPERLGCAYVINPPGIFTVAWTVVKAFLDKRTTKKVNFLTGDDWKTVLPEHFEASVLPKKYGGTNPICLDPPAKSALPKGPPKVTSMKKD